MEELLESRVRYRSIHECLGGSERSLWHPIHPCDVSPRCAGWIVSILVSPSHDFRKVPWQIRNCVVWAGRCDILAREEDYLVHVLLVEGGIVLGLERS
jgi:hypothetical protein